MIITAVFALSFLPTATIYGKDKSSSVTTNKSDYSPDEKVVILDKNFEPNTAYVIVVIRPPDGLIVTDDGTSTPGSDTITTNNGGNFNYQYTLVDVDGTFIVNVVGPDGEIKASTTFTDATVHW